VKKTLAIVAIASFLAVGLFAGMADAGSLADPIVEPEIVMADTVQSAPDVYMIVAALAIIAIILGAAGAF